MNAKLLVGTTNTFSKAVTSALGRVDLVAIFLLPEDVVLGHVLMVNIFQCTQINAPTIVLTVNISQL